jgi:hypothetical protein
VTTFKSDETFTAAPYLEPLIQRLREHAIRRPTDVARLDRAVAAGRLSPISTVDVHVLRAENYQQLGDFEQAMDACDAATTAAAPFVETHWLRLVCVFAVRAALAVWAGNHQADLFCEQYLDAARRDPQIARHREVYAQGLHAVATAREDCQLALAVLDDLLCQQASPDSPIAVMLHNAATAISNRCRQPHTPALRSPDLPPMPGGLWHPQLDNPDPDCLAWHCRAYPLGHTCKTAATPE